MHHLVEAIQTFAESLGGSGLALIAFLDSSFLTFPIVCDLQVIYLASRHPGLWWYYALMSTAGSLAGAYVIYALARRGGEAFLRRRVKARHIAQGMAALRRYGLLAVVVPSLLPPPMPFKIFVLLAGVSGVRPATFAAALVVGRGLRYGGEALLALTYGDAVAAFLRAHAVGLSLWTLAVIAVVVLAVFVGRRRRAA